MSDFLVPHPGIPMRVARCDERFSLGSRSDRNPGLCATGVFSLTGGIAAKIFNICHVARTHATPELTIVKVHIRDTNLVPEIEVKVTLFTTGHAHRDAGWWHQFLLVKLSKKP